MKKFEGYDINIRKLGTRKIDYDFANIGEIVKVGNNNKDILDYTIFKGVNNGSR